MVLFRKNNILTTNSYGCNDMCPKVFNKAIKIKFKVKDNLMIDILLLHYVDNLDMHTLPRMVDPNSLGCPFRHFLATLSGSL